MDFDCRIDLGHDFYCTSSFKSKLDVSSVTGAIVDSLVVLVMKELESEVTFLFCVGGGVESSLQLLEKEMVYGCWMLKGGDISIGSLSDVGGGDLTRASAYVEKWFLIIGTLLLVGDRRSMLALVIFLDSNLSASNCALYLFVVVVKSRYFPSSCVFLIGSNPKKYDELRNIS